MINAIGNDDGREIDRVLVTDAAPIAYIDLLLFGFLPPIELSLRTRVSNETR